MSDVNANINISIDSSQALGQLRALQEQISNFNRSIISGNVAAAQAQKDLTRNLTAQINATKGFTTSITNVESSVSRLGRSIDKNKLSLGEYFRYGIAASGTFGKAMREHNSIMELAGERVKRLQTQYIALEQAHNGYTRSMAVRPTNLFNADSAIAIQRQQIFNKLLHDGSTALVNWGKNTQWAGRQLMVGFTVPLTIFGGMAGKIFMDLEKQVVQFKRVYGDLATPAGEKNAMVEEVKALGKEFTKYGITVSDTIALAAKAAATGATGADLIAQTTEATRLATLGQIDYQQALDATISLQTAFGISSTDLAQATDFLNAVENQTVTSLDDITQAIPLVAPVIKGLGGDVRDLAIFMTAMREGGISANEGANALKSGLASLINPTKAAREQLAAVGINIDTILSKNKGDLRGLITEFGTALGTLGKFERQQTLAKMFGKYQFARMGALFANIAKEGSQAQRVVDLTALSAKELGQIAQGELSQLEEAVGVKFTAAVEKLKLAIAPIGEAFLKIATPIIEWVTKIADKFNELPDAAKTFLTWGAAIGGVLVPTIIMLVGLLGNFAGNMLKIGAAIGRLMGKTNGLSSGLEYLTMEELDAMAAAASLEGQTNSLTGSLNAQVGAVNRLAGSYAKYVSAANSAASNIPQGFRTPPRRMATGGIVPGSGNGDTVPAVLTPGESVMTKSATQKYGPILQAMNEGSLPGFKRGKINVGGTDVEADFYSDPARIAIQERIDKALQNQVATVGQILDIFRQVGDDLRISATSLSRINEEVFPAPKASSRHSARAAGIGMSVQTHLEGVGKGEEYLRALDAASGIEKEVNSYYDDQIAMARQRGDSEQQIAKLEQQRVKHLSSMVQIDRAHIVELTNAQKANEQAWSPDLWVAQTQAENQLSTLLTSRKENGVEQNKNLSLYLQELQKSDATQDMIESITRKVTAGIALTEEELQVQANVLKRMLASADTMAGTTPKFGAYAAGTVGAAAGRKGSSKAGYTRDLAQAQAVASQIGSVMGDTIVQTAGDPVRRIIEDPRNSPHPAVPEAASQDGSKYGKDFAQSAAAAMKEAGQKTDKAETPFGAMEDLETEKQLRAEAAKRKIVEAQITKEIEKRAMILQRQGIPAQAALVRAKQEVMAAKEQLLVEEQILEVEQKQAMADSVGGSVPTTGGVDGPEGGKDSKNVKRGMKAFGGKLMGAAFALDGLTFGLSMLDNGIGDFAQQLMPAIFGIQSIAMIASSMGGPASIAVAALAAVGFGLWKVNSNMEELRDNGRKMSEAMLNTTKSLNDTASFYNRTLITKKAAAKSLGTDVEQLSQAEQYLQTDTGKRMSEGFSIAMSQMGGEAATKQFATKLGSMIMQGAISPKEARAIADALETQLGMKGLAANIKGKLTSLIGKDGKDIQKHPMTVAVKLQAQNDDFITGIQNQLAGLQPAADFTGGGQLLSSAVAPFGGQALAAALQTSTMDIPLLSGVGRNIRSFFDPQFAALTTGANVYGTAVAAIAKDGYGVLNAATERYKKLQKEAAEEDNPKKKKELLANLKEQAKAIKVLESSMKDYTKKAAEAFSTQEEGLKAEALKGLEDSLATQFEGTPEAFALQSVLGQTSSLEKDVQFNIKTAIASGELSPSLVAGFMDQFTNKEDAGATLNMLIKEDGLNSTSKQILDILSIKDKSIQKQAILNLQVREGGVGGQEGTEGTNIYKGTPLAKRSEGASEAEKKRAESGLSSAQEEFNMASQDYYRGGAIMDVATEQEISTLQSYDDEVRRVTEALKDQGKTEEEIYKDKGFLDAYNKREQYAAELAATYDEQYSAYEVFQTKEAALAKAKEDLNKVLGDTTKLAPGAELALRKIYGNEKERADAINDFLILKDQIQEISGQEIKFNTDGATLDEIKDINKVYAKLAKAPKKLLKVIDVNSLGAKDAVDIFSIKWKNMESAADIEKRLGLEDGQFTSALDAAGMDWAEFDALPNINKRLVTTYLTRYLWYSAEVSRAEGEAAAAAGTDASGRAAGNTDARRWAKQADAYDVDQQLALNDAEQSGKITGEDKEKGPKDPNGTPPGGDNTGGGGGGGTDPVEELRKSIMDRMRLYLNITKLINKVKNTKKGFTKELLDSTQYNGSLADQLRKMNLSESLVLDILSKGPENAKKIMDKLGKKGLKEQNRKMLAGMRGEQVSGFVGQKRTSKNQMKAMDKLAGVPGLTPDQINEIVSDEAQAEVIASLTKGSKAWEEYIGKLKQAAKAAEDFKEAQDPVGYQLEAQTAMFGAIADTIDNAFEAEFNKIERNHKTAIKSYEDQIDTKQEEIDVIEKEIDAIERLNDADERRIRTAQRDKEMIGRDIENLERSNELDQRKIENLQREDELRNRIADKLQNELENLSDQENKVKEAYDARLNALNDVVKLNQQIIDQQKNQINLAQALSQGDVYAAAQAQKDMEQSQVQFASDQMRSSLEAGRDNAIAGLRTESGLTREQAEAQINTIKQQSYQTSLAIRDIEDVIYQRNQEITVLKDKQYQIDLLIRQIEDAIYDRETQIQEIQVSRLQPRQDELTALQDSLENENKMVEKEKEGVVVGGLKYEQWQATKQQVSDAFALQESLHNLMQTSMLPGVRRYAKTWVQVGKAIEAAYNAQSGGGFDFNLNMDESAIPTIPGIELTNMNNVDWMGKLQEYITNLQNATANANAAGQSLGMFAGGKVMKYATGSIVGDGGRDSVPSMLTPGEFVVRKSMVDKYGSSMLNSINQGSFSVPKYSAGGPKMSMPVSNRADVKINSAPVYNTYSVNVNASTNANADDIANTVITKIRNIESGSIRRINGY